MQCRYFNITDDEVKNEKLLSHLEWPCKLKFNQFEITVQLCHMVQCNDSIDHNHFL